MAQPPLSPGRIIDNAIFCNTAFALAYTDPDQKWIVREHLLSLHREFPSLHPTAGTFVHDNGLVVNLLKAEGRLHVSRSLPPVHLAIWIHEHYPYSAPIVKVSSTPSNPIRSNHPFVNPSGTTTSAYLHTWAPTRHDLLGLAYSLVKLFSLDHPFELAGSPNLSHPSYTSKTDCMDRLRWMLHYDTITLTENTNDEIRKLTALQTETRTRVETATRMIVGLHVEKTDLNHRVRETGEEADRLVGWLAENAVSLRGGAMGGEVEDAFECSDEESSWAMELIAEDRALEDVMNGLFEALRKGVVGHEAYIKEVRGLARDQFFVRAKLEKLKGPQIFEFLD